MATQCGLFSGRVPTRRFASISAGSRAITSATLSGQLSSGSASRPLVSSVGDEASPRPERHFFFSLENSSWSSASPHLLGRLKRFVRWHLLFSPIRSIPIYCFHFRNYLILFPELIHCVSARWPPIVIYDAEATFRKFWI